MSCFWNSFFGWHLSRVAEDLPLFSTIYNDWLEKPISYERKIMIVHLEKKTTLIPPIPIYLIHFALGLPKCLTHLVVNTNKFYSLPLLTKYKKSILILIL